MKKPTEAGEPLRIAGLVVCWVGGGLATFTSPMNRLTRKLRGIQGWVLAIQIQSCGHHQKAALLLGQSVHRPEGRSKAAIWWPWASRPGKIPAALPGWSRCVLLRIPAIGACGLAFTSARSTFRSRSLRAVARVWLALSIGRQGGG